LRNAILGPRLGRVFQFLVELIDQREQSLPVTLLANGLTKFLNVFGKRHHPSPEYRKILANGERVVSYTSLGLRNESYPLACY
jgi:hypothetical protein